MTSAMERYEEEPSIGTTIATYGDLAGQIAQTEFVPKAMRGKPAAVLSCMLYGKEIGLGPMQSLRLIDVIEGTPGIKPEGMRALVRQAGHKIWPENRSDESCTMAGYRVEDGPELTVRVTWGMAEARKAELDKKQNYRKYPRAMFDARATAELCRLHFADVIGGLSYTPEEISDFDDDRPAAPVAAFPSTPAPRALETQSRPVEAKDEGDPFPAEQPATRRRPPPQQVKPGYVSASEAKALLEAEFMRKGLDAGKARVEAARSWGTRGIEPITGELLDQLVASVLVNEYPPADDGAPFDDQPSML